MNGGPEKYTQTIYDAGKEAKGYDEGKADGKKETFKAGLLILIFMGLLKLVKMLWDKIKPKKKNPERHVSEEELRKAKKNLAAELKRQEKEQTAEHSDNQQQDNAGTEEKEGGRNDM